MENKNTMDTKTETRALTCELSEAELIARGDEMAKTYIQVAALDMQKKRITAQIKPLDERIEELVTIIDTKQEERKVKCEWQYEWALGVKRLFRTDTYEQIDSDTIRESERQQHLRLTNEEVPGGSDDVSDVLPHVVDQDEAGDEITICHNIDCEHCKKDEPNGCSIYEYVSECDKSTGPAELVIDTKALED